MENGENLERFEKALIKYDIKQELYFKNPLDEYEYFKKKLKEINKYVEDFFKTQALANLANRYIRAIAEAGDSFETSALVRIYKDCLEELGIDGYQIESEVENYKMTHESTKENNKNSEKTVSERGRK